MTARTRFRPRIAARVAVLAALTAAAVGLVADARERAPVQAEASSCPEPTERVAQTGDEARGCCVLVTASGPSCAYSSRGYCAMRAMEAGVQFEFHEVASCAELQQCR